MSTYTGLHGPLALVRSTVTKSCCRESGFFGFLKVPSLRIIWGVLGFEGSGRQCLDFGACRFDFGMLDEAHLHPKPRTLSPNRTPFGRVISGFADRSAFQATGRVPFDTV